MSPPAGSHGGDAAVLGPGRLCRASYLRIRASPAVAEIPQPPDASRPGKAHAVAVSAFLYTSQAAEAVAADHRRDLLARARLGAIRRRARIGSRWLWPGRSRPVVEDKGAVGVPAGTRGRVAHGSPVIDLCAAESRAAEVDLRSVEERPVPSLRW